MVHSETIKFDFSGKEKRIYLASPYTHEDEETMVFRYEGAVQATAILINKGFLVFSPIAHCHPIAVAHTLPRDYKFWQDYSTSFLLHWAEAVIVLLLPEALNSKGVQAEIVVALEAGLPVYYKTLY